MFFPPTGAAAAAAAHCCVTAFHLDITPLSLPQPRRCQKSPHPLSLRERQPPPRQPQRTGAWPTPPSQQGSSRAAGERPGRLPWSRRPLPLRPRSPSLYPSASARPPRKEISCGLRPRGACSWSGLAPREPEVNRAPFHPRAPCSLISI